jgi:hypothetical protein
LGARNPRGGSPNVVEIGDTCAGMTAAIDEMVTSECE